MRKRGGGCWGRWCSGLGSSGSGHLCGHCVWDRDDGRAGADVGDVGLCARSHRGDACSVKATDTFNLVYVETGVFLLITFLATVLSNDSS